MKTFERSIYKEEGDLATITQSVRQLKYIINKGVEWDLYTAQAMEALCAAWSAELNGMGVVPDHDRGAGLVAFRDKNELLEKRRNMARDFWTTKSA